MTFSFYAFWKPKETNDQKSNLIDYFGASNVIECLNRVDHKIVECPASLVREQLMSVDLSVGENWLEVENVIGLLIQNIDL